MITIKSDILDALDVLKVIGLSSILESETGQTCRIKWNDTDPNASLQCGELNIRDAAIIVEQHAKKQMDGNSWIIHETENEPGKARGTLTSKPLYFKDEVMWKKWQESRQDLLSKVAGGQGLSNSALSLRLISSFGEPAYWSNAIDKSDSRWGASPWLMTTANQGKDFQRSTLAKTGVIVAQWDSESIESSLMGIRVNDELGGNKDVTRTPAGLRAPGRTDNAEAWLAFWGLSVLPVRPVTPPVGSKTYHRSYTAGFTEKHFFLPISGKPTTLARYRAVMRSDQLQQVVKDILVANDKSCVDSLDVQKKWLLDHGFLGVTTYKRHSTSGNTPENWAESGKFHFFEVDDSNAG